MESFACREGRRTVPVDVDLRDARRFDLPRMMDALRLSLAELAVAFVMPASAIQRISYPTLRWCAQCAREGTHLTLFQYRSLDVCPVHDTPLRQRCEQCGATIPYRLRAELFRSPFSCPSCARPWWNPAHGADDLRIGDRYRRRLGHYARDRALVGDAFPGLGALNPGDKSAGAAFHQDEQEQQWICFGTADRDEAETFWYEVAELHSFDGDAQARVCYKAVRRRIMKLYGRGHRRCIATAARHLTWPLTGSTTASFCPVAQAFLRWRCKWEGMSIPRSLLLPPLHGPLGLTIWLSVGTPVAPQIWTPQAAHWLTLHSLVQACLDSFGTYLAEAKGAGEHRRALWLPFPVHDFPRCTIFVRGGRYRDDPVAIQVLSAGERPDKPGKPNARSAADHIRVHLLQLSRNVRPA
jgi:hypothetical protein